jgi:hypothetical protein
VERKEMLFARVAVTSGKRRFPPDEILLALLPRTGSGADPDEPFLELLVPRVGGMGRSPVERPMLWKEKPDPMTRMLSDMRSLSAWPRARWDFASRLFSSETCSAGMFACGNIILSGMKSP